jgi:hypothetical protein
LAKAALDAALRRLKGEETFSLPESPGVPALMLGLGLVFWVGLACMDEFPRPAVTTGVRVIDATELFSEPAGVATYLDPQLVEGFGGVPRRSERDELVRKFDEEDPRAGLRWASRGKREIVGGSPSGRLLVEVIMADSQSWFTDELNTVAMMSRPDPMISYQLLHLHPTHYRWPEWKVDQPDADCRMQIRCCCCCQLRK